MGKKDFKDNSKSNHNHNDLLNAMDYAASKGADSCEIYRLETTSSSLQMRLGEISDCKFAGQKGFSVRLLKDGKLGFAYGTIANEANLRQAVDDALVSAAFLPVDEDDFFTAPGKTYPEIPVDSEIKKTELSFADKKEILQDLTAAAAADSRAAKVERASLSEEESTVEIVNSLGLNLSRHGALVSASATVLAEENGEEQLGGEFELAKQFSAIDYKTLGEKAAADAIGKLGAVSISSCSLPVIFRPEAVADLLGLILPSFLGNRVLKGMSRLANCLGETVAAESVSLYDDAFHPAAVMPIPFDDEGQPCGRHALLEKGVLKEFLYNNKYGRRAGKESTGNGFCNYHHSLPGVTPVNFCLEKGNTSLSDMYVLTGKALEVKDLMGLHMADSVSGDFSLGASGRLIENSEPVCNVRGIMIAGNLFELLKDIIAVCNDVRSFGYGVTPSILIKSLKISGK